MSTQIGSSSSSLESTSSRKSIHKGKEKHEAYSNEDDEEQEEEIDVQYIVLNLVNDINSQKNNKERESGFRTFFDKEMSVKKESIHSITVDQSKIDSLKQLFKPYSQSKEPIGIFVTNSRAYLLPELLEDMEFKADRTIIGYDLNPGNIKLLEENKIQFIINQQPEYQGYSAVKGLFKMITEDDDADLYQKIPVEIVVKENIK